MNFEINMVGLFRTSVGTSEQGHLLYRDDDHLSQYAVELVAEAFVLRFRDTLFIRHAGE